MRSWKELKCCPFHFKRFPHSFALTACLAFQTYCWMFFLQSRSTREAGKHLPPQRPAIAWAATTVSLHMDIVWPRFPYQWCTADGVWAVTGLTEVRGKKSCEPICIFRLQTNQWLLSKGMICSGSSLAILIPQLHTFVPFFAWTKCVFPLNCR